MLFIPAGTAGGRKQHKRATPLPSVALPGLVAVRTSKVHHDRNIGGTVNAWTAVVARKRGHVRGAIAGIVCRHGRNASASAASSATAAASQAPARRTSEDDVSRPWHRAGAVAAIGASRPPGA